MQNKLATPEDYMRYELTQAKQTIEQLRDNAKGHKKTVDKMSAKVSLLTQQLDESERERMVIVSQLNEATAVIMRGDGGRAKADKKEQSDLSKSLCFMLMTVSAGFFMAMGASLALFSIGVIGK